jgi:hypothetical protein
LSQTFFYFEISTFPPNEYANLVSFIKQINKADQSKVVFVK